LNELNLYLISCIILFFCGKLEGKRILGRPRRRWEDEIRMDLRINFGVDSNGSG
jgi:hypothetical protein